MTAKPIENQDPQNLAPLPQHPEETAPQTTPEPVAEPTPAPTKRHRERNFKITSLSFDNPATIQLAKKRARALHMSFSGYVLALVERDLASAGLLDEDELALIAPPRPQKRKTQKE